MAHTAQLVVSPRLQWHLFLVDHFSLLQIHPRPQVQEALGSDQRGEVGGRRTRRGGGRPVRPTNTARSCLPFRLKKICEIYSRVLGSEEALHVSVGAGRWNAGPPQWKVRRRAKPISCVHLCPSAGALRGEELVRRGVLRRLLHGLLPPGNPDPVRKVSLPHGRRVHTIHAFIRCQTITFILLSSFYPIMFPDKLKDLVFFYYPII